jgi:hypothetical protein
MANFSIVGFCRRRLATAVARCIACKARRAAASGVGTAAALRSRLARIRYSRSFTKEAEDNKKFNGIQFARAT